MLTDNTLWLNYAVALGIGLLIGAERERNKAVGRERSAAGIRTFSIAALLGAMSVMINVWLLLVTLICVSTFALSAYLIKKEDHPGLTTEIALLATVILGGLSISAAALSASLAVCVVILLAAKEPMHAFVRGVVTKEELNDFLILSGATLIVLPLVPNQFIGPFAAINPRNLWLIVILVMFISALGHLVLRWLGGRIGLPVIGLISGFISSIATIGTMGQRAREFPHLMAPAVAGAMLSNLATILQITLLLAAINIATLHALAIPLIFGGVSVIAYGLFVTLHSLRESGEQINKPSHSFGVKTALLLTTVIAIVLITSAGLKAWFGQTGLIVGSALAGLADAHAATISVATLVSTGKLAADAAAIPILAAFSLNALSKAVMAVVSGGKKFAMQVVPGLLVQVSAVWVGWWL